MTSYQTFKSDVESIKMVLTECIRDIGYELFKQEKGYKVTQVLPGDNEEYVFSSGDLSGYIHTRERKVYDLMYDDSSLSLINISTDPSILDGIIEEIWEEWYAVFGENEHERGHPGEPHISKPGGKRMISELQEQHTTFLSDPSFSDLLSAIKDGNYGVAMKLLGVEDVNQVLDPTVGHEMHHLFSHGDINVYYEDDTIAVVKPDYNHSLRREVEKQKVLANSPRNSMASVVDDDELEYAYVVGRDDTPVGLFAHSIDGTNLTQNSTITAKKIYTYMGFDKQYEDTKYAELDVGERMRIQGDLAIEYISQNTVTEDMGNCYIPIDNHYIALTHGELPENESKTSEPIHVNVPQDSVVNISHDEHENITLHLDEGQYKFYLLERGLKPQSERPKW